MRFIVFVIVLIVVVRFITIMAGGKTNVRTPQAAGTDGKTPHAAGTDGRTPHAAGTDGRTPHAAGTDGKTPQAAGTDGRTQQAASSASQQLQVFVARLRAVVADRRERPHSPGEVAETAHFSRSVGPLSPPHRPSAVPPAAAAPTATGPAATPRPAPPAFEEQTVDLTDITDTAVIPTTKPSPAGGATATGPRVVPLSPDLENQARELMGQGHEVMAVRLLCDQLGVGILDAQKTVRTLVGLPTQY